VPDQEEPRHLYKFRSLAGDSKDRLVKIFTNQELYFPHPSEFNDPFDCLPSFTYKASDAETKAYLRRLVRDKEPGLSRNERRAKERDFAEMLRPGPAMKQFEERMTEGMRKAERMAGIFSMAEDWKSILMWSHYADSHRGVCLRFKRSVYEPFFGRAQPVAYRSDRPLTNAITDDPWVYVEKTLLTKASCWSYEREWRLIEHERGAGIHAYPKSCLDGVILGAKISPEHRALVMELVAGYGSEIEVMMASVSKRKFEVELSAI